MANQRTDSNNKHGSKKTGFKKDRYARGQKPNPKAEAQTNNNTSTPVRNEFKWYNANPQLTEAVARIPFPYRPGMNLPAWQTMEGVSNYKSFPQIMPGLMVLNWVPTVGESTDTTSPISLAARDMFSKVRSAFSGSIAADAPDFVIQVMAIDSIYTYLSWLKRVYKTVDTFSPNNHLTPTVLLKGMGFSDKQIVELRREKVKLWGMINQLIAMTDKLLVPDIFPVITRHMWMSERTYCDAPTSNSQLYMFNPAAYYKFTVDTDGAGMLEGKTLKFTATGSITNQLYTFGVELIDALTSWDDCYIINGYIARAYEGSKMVSIQPLGADEKLELAYNTVVLSQIENCTFPCIPTFPRDLTIKQKVSSNAILTNVKLGPATGDAAIQNTKFPTIGKLRLNIRNDAPSVEEVVEASRLSCMYSYAKEENVLTVTPYAYATEVICDVKIAKAYVGADGTIVMSGVSSIADFMLTTQANASEQDVLIQGSIQGVLLSLSVLSSFDWHPHFVVNLNRANAQGAVDAGDAYLFGDLANTAFLSEDQVKEINRVCLYSEFNSFANG